METQDQNYKRKKNHYYRMDVVTFGIIEEIIILCSTSSASSPLKAPAASETNKTRLMSDVAYEPVENRCINIPKETHPNIHIRSISKHQILKHHQFLRISIQVR